MDNEKKTKVANALKSKGVNLPCPRCGSMNFEVVGQTFLDLNDKPNVVILGGPSVPMAIITCSHCGFVTLHALGALDLMPNVKENNTK